MIRSKDITQIQKHPQSSSFELKKAKDVCAGEKEKAKTILNERLYWAYKGWERRRRVVPENTQDKVEDFIYKTVSYVVFIVRKVLPGRPF